MAEGRTGRDRSAQAAEASARRPALRSAHRRDGRGREDRRVRAPAGCDGLRVSGHNSLVTTAELEQPRRGTGHRRRRRRAGRAVRGDRAAHRASGGPAGCSPTCGSRWRSRKCPAIPSACSRARAPSSPRRSATTRRRREPGRARAGCRATRGTTPTPSCARSSTRSAGGSAAPYRVLVDANQHVDREGAVRAGDRLLRQEHDADHAPPRLLGRARDARHRRRDRAEPPLDARLRRVPALHRRLPDRRARRARDARRRRAASRTGRRRRRRSPRTTGRRSARWSTAATSARTSARGTAGSRSAGAGGAPPDERSRPSRSSTGSTADGDELVRAVRPPVRARGTTRATSAGTRSSRSATSARPEHDAALPSRYADGRRPARSASTPSGRSRRLGSGADELRAARCGESGGSPGSASARSRSRCSRRRSRATTRPAIGRGPGRRRRPRGRRGHVFWSLVAPEPSARRLVAARSRRARLRLRGRLVVLLVLTFDRATPIRQVLILVLIEAAFRYGISRRARRSSPRPSRR